VVPKTNATFWQAKRQSNVERDARAVRALEELGVTPVIVWECETRRPDKLGTKLVKALRRRKR
jgi:DNA mismatch endonuclease (patch repair protein)